MPDQPYTFSRCNSHRKVVIQRLRVAVVGEGHVLEADLAFADHDRAGVGLVFHSQRLTFKRHELFHVVDRTLQIAHVHPDFTQIPLQHEEHGQRERDVAYAGFVGFPQQQRSTKNGRLHDHQHAALHTAVDRAAFPRTPRTVTPLADHAGKPRFLARLRAEGLDHGVAAHRVCQRTAHAGIPRVAEASRGRNEAERQADGHRNIEQRPDAHDHAHHGPVKAQQHRCADEHDQRRQQRHEQRVVEQVERPHAARDLAHGRTGEAVAVPVGGETLHAMKCVRGNFTHHLQRQHDDVHERELAQQRAGQSEEGQRGERGRGRAPCQLLAGRAGSECVHEPPCVERRQDVGQCRQQREQDDGHDAPRLLAPMSNGETENVLERTSAEVDFFCVSHLPQPVARRATRLSGQEKMRATAGARLHVRAN